jgi:hypothetical protein
MQHAKSFDLKGNWFRWSRYDLFNGVVVPAEGAKLIEYDPWHAFRVNEGKYRTVEQPYTTLLELNRNLIRLESTNVRPSRLHARYFFGDAVRGPQNAADRLILDWCNLHGLLGLVPVLSNSIRLRAEAEVGTHEQSRVMRHRHHFRIGGIWHSHLVTVNPAAATSEATEEADRGLADQVPGAALTWFNWPTHIYEEKPLEHIRDFFLPTPFGMYFPEEDHFAPPCPNSGEFWARYGEPVEGFTRWCRLFATSVDCLSQAEGGHKSDEDVRAIEQSFWALSGLAHSVAPAFRLIQGGGRVDEARVSAGLLASYALMFLWDRMEGRRAIRCQNCDSRFISNDSRALYCSRRCRNTAQSKRSRSKKKIRKQGVSHGETRTE